MVGIVGGVDLTAVTARTIAVAVAVGEVALARGHHANALFAAARGGARDHARTAAVRVAAELWVRTGYAHAGAGLVISGAAFLQRVGVYQE